jgi:hypothetical protein
VTIINKEPVEGTVNFIQHNLPGLDAGAYMVSVSQIVSTQATPLSNAYFFAVQGPRFALRPDDVYATYPPDLAEGEFDNTLPHVVLTSQTLPWLRYPTLTAPEREYADGKHDRDIPSWLAVLLFDVDDEKNYPAFRAQARTAAVRDLFIRRTGTNPNQGYSYFYRAGDLGSDGDRASLALHLEYGQTPDDPCRIIDVPLALFWKIAPSVDDLKMTAHLRNVNIIRKATENGVPTARNDLSQVPGTSDFALVLGNRVPRTGVRAFAHLVSLEGLAPFLPSDPAADDDPDKITNPTRVTDGNAFDINPGGFLRLVSLKSWSFTSTGDSSHFEQLLKALQPKTAAPLDFSIGLPAPAASPSDTPATAQAKKALAMGYTALQHQTRDGGHTVSWYRGPLLPYRVTTNVLPATLTLSSTDAATIYDPHTGMFDIGYAAAWQIGRLVALQDKHFSVLVYNWRARNLRASIARMEALIVQQTLDQIQQQLRDDNLIYPLLTAFLPAAATTATGANGSDAGLATARARRADAHRAALTDPSGLPDATKDQLSVPYEIYTWLARLKLLEGVPFRYLVPDERMLPPESIRFFYLDMNWIDAALDGALSIGRNAHATDPSPETTHDVTMAPLARQAADAHARRRRPMALGVAAPAPAPLETVSGFVLRSDVVRGWPGLEVNGYADDGTLLDIVRFERLAPSVLLCLFEKDGKTLREVDIHEPAEGLHFGLATGPSINVRYNHASGGKGPGSQVQNLFQSAPVRDAGRVVRMFRLAKDLLDSKYSQYIQGIYEEFHHLPSSQFAMQMLRGVGLVSFTSDGGAS